MSFLDQLAITVILFRS